ncbi:hypothetical protein SAMN02745119_00340 [Trichlorobacter thiogenes]|uniref:Uncharacterized protein n=1 Tax=Trichlorobacter thiogenes TaxID=115783 RepID=A0A1T4K649_9BACT|nr:transporter substrate-binding domain-containing protein [Trichlorobacter thiogenes]SJZ37899.1 hypothetical protein SAMN02745119_00340 [Trichlorobacter thiogenes]
MKKLLSTLLLVAMTVPTWGADDTPLKSPAFIEYVSPEQSVWTTRTAKTGEPLNPLLCVADKLFSKANIPWHSRSYPAARMFKSLQDGTAQFSMLVKSPALQECCLLSRKPVTVLQIRVYHLDGKAPIKSLNDLAGKNIITIHGYSYGSLFRFFDDKRNRITNNVVQTPTAAFRMLAVQRADYVIDYVGPASEVLATTPIPGILWEVLSRQDVYLVLAKNYPDAPKVMAHLEAIAATIDVEKILWEAQQRSIHP